MKLLDQMRLQPDAPILVVTGPDGLLAGLEPELVRRVPQVDVRATSEGVGILSRYRVICVDVDGLTQPELARVMRLSGLEIQTAVLTVSGAAADTLRERFGSWVPQNFVAKIRGELDAADLLTTFDKMRGISELPTSAYFLPLCTTRTLTLRAWADKPALLTELHHLAVQLSGRDRAAQRVVNAADEILVLARGTPEANERSGGGELSLDLCFDGRRFGLRMVEPARGRTRAQMEGALTACWATGAPRAAQAPDFCALFQVVSHLAVTLNSARGWVETVALINAVRPLEPATQPKSLNVFHISEKS